MRGRESPSSSSPAASKMHCRSPGRTYMGDLAIKRPAPLYSDLLDVDERSVLQSYPDPNLRTMKAKYPEPLETITGMSVKTAQVVEHIPTSTKHATTPKIYLMRHSGLSPCARSPRLVTRLLRTPFMYPPAMIRRLAFAIKSQIKNRARRLRDGDASRFV